MSQTMTGYTFLRHDNNMTRDLYPLAITECIPGNETVRQSRTFTLNDGSTVMLTPPAFNA